MTEQEHRESTKQLMAAIEAIEAQRATLGDTVVDAMIAAARKELATQQQAQDRAQDDALEEDPAMHLVQQQLDLMEVTPHAVLQGERKLVTIMFADISGFTALAETLDPEVVRDLMNACFEHLVPIIEKYEGTVDKFLGDAIMVLFGAPVAHENDPERALRTALELIDALDAFNSKRGTDLGLHIGINSGTVIAGGIGPREQQEYSVMGDAVNLAARLEDASGRDEILVGPDTHRLTAPLFEFEPLAPLQVKGKRQPVQVFRLQRAKPRSFHLATRGIESIDTPMIGRDEELKLLQDTLRKALTGPRQMVTVTGEAGVGKSRLLYELESWMGQLPERIHCFKGRVSAEMQHSPYALFRDLFSFSFQVKDSDPASLMRQKIEEGFTQVFGDSNLIRPHFVGQLLGFDFSDSPHLQTALDDAQQIRNRALIYLSEFFQATTQLAPTAIFLEDIHWADDSSLDMILHLARATGRQHLLIICLARPTLFERRPRWPSWSSPLPHGPVARREHRAASEKAQGYSLLQLQPLSIQDSHRLVEEALQKVDPLPATLRNLVVSRAEGNPFYVEELIKMLIEDGVIIKEPARWWVDPSRLTQVRVPATLTGVLQARLDSLPAEERTLLQQASVVGRTFWDSAVERISASARPRIDDPAQDPWTPEKVPDGLASLQDKEMVFRRKISTFAQAQEYIFKHAILREVTYESVLKRVRRIYHALVASWLIEHSGERAGEVTGLIADHLELAGQTEQALTYLRRAGEQAAAQFANAEAVNFFSRALALTPVADLLRRYNLLLSRESVYDLQGAREAQRQDLAALQDLADTLDEASPHSDGSRRAVVALRQANYARVTGDYAQAIAAAQSAIAATQAVHDTANEAAGYLQWALALWRLGDFENCRARLEQALPLARRTASRQVEADSLRIIGNVYYYLGDYTNATAYWEQALPISRQIGDRAGEASALSNLGEGARSQGAYAQARAYYEQRLLICREIGERHGETIALLNVSLVSHNLGDNQAAYDHGQQALGLARETGNRSHQGYALTCLGHALSELERPLEATDAYQQAVALRQELGEQHLAVESRAGLALVHLNQGDLPQAQAQIECVLDFLENNTLDGTEEPLRVYLAGYQVLRAAQDPRAGNILAAAHALLQERAARIPDENLRRTFLENVAAHREILRLVRG